jgi:hypothetical protein
MTLDLFGRLEAPRYLIRICSFWNTPVKNNK